MVALPYICMQLEKTFAIQGNFYGEKASKKTIGGAQITRIIQQPTEKQSLILLAALQSSPKCLAMYLPTFLVFALA